MHGLHAYVRLEDR